MRDGRFVRIIIAICIAALILVVASGCTSESSTGGSSNDSGSSGTGLSPSDNPELDKGRQLIESKCDMCHTLDRIESAQKDSDGWTKTVERMRGQGAVLTDEEAQQIVDYLASR